ncbi:hypothetical protein E2320_005412, partial [Naja naja]
PGIDGSALAEASLTDSYFSTSFVGVNGFGSPAESKYPMMQRMTNSSSSPSLLNDSAKPYAGHGWIYTSLLSKADKEVDKLKLLRVFLLSRRILKKKKHHLFRACLYFKYESL